MNSITILEWIGPVFAILGAMLIANKKIQGFYIFSMYNISWLLMSIKTNQYGVGALMIMYLFINCWGIHNWRKKS